MKKKILVIAAILVFLGILPIGIKAEEVNEVNVREVTSGEEFLAALNDKAPKIKLTKDILI